jgi:hypothetical protein
MKLNYTVEEDCRPCLVNGTKALFHRWAEKDQIILKAMAGMSEEKIVSARKKFEEIGVVPRALDVEHVKGVFALVEFENGVTMEVEPSLVQFLDAGAKFAQYAFGPGKENTTARPSEPDQTETSAWCFAIMKNQMSGTAMVQAKCEACGYEHMPVDTLEQLPRRCPSCQRIMTAYHPEEL